MFDLGMQEILVIFVVSLLLFGPKNMPEVAKNIGKFIRYFRKMFDQIKEQINDEIQEDTTPLKEEFDKINKDFLKSVQEFHSEHKPFEYPSVDSIIKKPEATPPTSHPDTTNQESSDTTAKPHQDTHSETKTENK
ncbi:MAG: twin-arginine translocase subunit TatB [Nitrospirae bacterium]|nr:twin-arginine translocase subunit TatB [Nitrospirota bacterium]